MFIGVKIGTRLAVGFAVVLLALVAIWGVSAMEIRQSIALAENAAQRHDRTVALSRAQGALWTLRWNDIQLEASPASGRKDFVERFARSRQLFLEALAPYAQTGALAGDEAGLLAALRTSFGRYDEAHAQWLALLDAGKPVEAGSFSAASLLPAQEQAFAALTRLVDLHDKLANRGDDAAQAELNGLLLTVSAAGIAALLLGGVLSWLLARSITTPLANAVAAIEAVARGDLAQPLTTHSSDEIGRLLSAVATMRHSLRQLVGEVMAGARSVADTSAQIAQGNIELSQRTEEQASTLEETASSMEQLSATVQQNAESARAANERAASASTVAVRGGAAVSEVVRTMSGISEASRRIGDITSVIDAIAFQTNILALNAAVEAARAGTQGRGFAVVATEVRNLAQRSAAAAREIKTLIGSSVEQVEAGTRQVDAAGRTMQDIVASVRQVGELIAEIAAASQEQSSGIRQVSVAVTQMDQVVQQNASLAEEATAATEAMKDQAAVLLRTVARFELGQQAAATAAPAFPARPAPRPLARPAPARLPPTAQRTLATSGAPPGAWREF
jgi:methyl-accepting chemotaxis protein